MVDGAVVIGPAKAMVGFVFVGARQGENWARALACSASTGQRVLAPFHPLTR
jgi:hypothetical protein